MFSGGSPFVPETVLALQTRVKPINILECFCHKEQEVKCYNLTFGPDLLGSASLTDRMLIKMSVFFLHELYNPQICPWRLLLILFKTTTTNRVSFSKWRGLELNCQFFVRESRALAPVPTMGSGLSPGVKTHLCASCSLLA